MLNTRKGKSEMNNTNTIELMKSLRIKSLNEFIEHIKNGEYAPDFLSPKEHIEMAKNEINLLQNITN